MYNAYFGFSDSPFENSLDQRFFFLSKSHREVLAALIYFVRENKAFALICGDVGTGKTMLINAFVNRLEQDIHPIIISNPFAEFREILKYIATILKIDQASTKDSLELNEIVKETLRKNGDLGQRYVLIVDEAHLLSDQGLENVRLLSNIETEDRKLLQLLLVGQYELSRKLERPQMRQLRQRININRFLEPLDPDETIQYIDYRLKVVGSAFEACFESKCDDLIYNMTKGIPRRINQLCDSALLLCKTMGVRKVNKKVLKLADEAIHSDVIYRPSDFKMEASQGSPRWLKAVLVVISFIFALSLLILMAYNYKIGLDLSNLLQKERSKVAKTVEEPPTAAQDSPLRTGLPAESVKAIPEEIQIAKKEDSEKSLPKQATQKGLSKSDVKNEPREPEKTAVQTESSRDTQLISEHSARNQRKPGQRAQGDPKKTDTSSRKEAAPSQPPGKKRDSSQNATAEYQPKTITVKKGDTLFRIALKWYPANPRLGIKAIRLENPEIGNSNRIYPGQSLVLPDINFELGHIKSKNGLYYAPYKELRSMESLRHELTKLDEKKIKCVINSGVDQRGNTVYQITLGGYKKPEDLIGAFHSLKKAQKPDQE